MHSRLGLRCSGARGISKSVSNVLARLAIRAHANAALAQVSATGRLKSVMALPNQGSLSSPSRARARSRCPNPTADDEILLLFLSPNAQAGHPSRRLLLFSSPNAQAGPPSRRNVDPSRRNVD